ncbi:MAG TPA: ABC transporter permease [Candidatus Acidoferrales bacterium]|nr:ABC transporter permease [Candidatus Acidoferrales bacterium]
MHNFWGDVRYGARGLFKNPWFTLVALVTLALGIGMNTAIFTIIDSVLLHPLPYPEPQNLIGFTRAAPPKARQLQSLSPFGVFSYPDFEDLRAQARSLEQVAAYHEAQVTFTRTGATSQPESIHGVVASADMLPLLRARPLLGRLFGTSDDRQAAAPVALLGEAFWRARFHADAGIIGHTIELNDEAYTVIGVLPATLRFPPFVVPAEIWMPLGSDPNSQLRQMRQARGLSYLFVIGRLKAGASVAQADAETKTISDRLSSNFPFDKGRTIGAVSLGHELVKNYQLALLVLLAAVGLVLLIACVNVANLLVARAAVREREVAVRMALGAGRARIVRQMLMESVELCLAGGAAGVALAELALAGFTRHLPPTMQEFQAVKMNGPVLLLSAAVSIGAGLLVGFLPALRLSDLRVYDALKASGRSGSELAAKGRLREALVVAEVALAVILLVGSGLLLRSFARLVSVPLGFDPRGVLMAPVNLPRAVYGQPAEWQSFVSTALERIEAQPGVEQAAASVSPPMGGMRITLTFSVPGHPAAPDEMPVADYRPVTPGYFELLRIPLLRGRAFQSTDTAGSRRVCVINEALGRYFRGEDPLSQQIAVGLGNREPCQVVGIVGNEVTGSLSSTSDAAIYSVYAQDPLFSMSFLVRAGGDPAALSGALREQLDAIDHELPVAPVPMATLLDRSLAQDRFRTLAVALFAALAILLAAIGISGVLGYSVSRRTQEIGVRMALGATPGGVLRQVVREGLTLAAAGAVAGLAAAFGLTRLMRTLLYKVSPADALTYIGVALLLVVVALLACALPALRASKIDPNVALRYE